MTYEGGWLDGKRHGKGRAVYSDGSVYEGRFEADQMTGEGRMTTPDGLVFEGTWKAGLLDGPGRAVYPNRDAYEGNFVAGERQGQGRMVFVGGQEFAGEWEDGEPVLVDDAPIPPMSDTEKDLLSIAIRECWSVPAGVTAELGDGIEVKAAVMQKVLETRVRAQLDSLAEIGVGLA